MRCVTSLVVCALVPWTLSTKSSLPAGLREPGPSSPDATGRLPVFGQNYSDPPAGLRCLVPDTYLRL